MLHGLSALRRDVLRRMNADQKQWRNLWSVLHDMRSSQEAEYQLLLSRIDSIIQRGLVGDHGDGGSGSPARL